MVASTHTHYSQFIKLGTTEPSNPIVRLDSRRYNTGHPSKWLVCTSTAMLPMSISVKNIFRMQGFIRDFSFGGDMTCCCYDKTLLSLGGSGGMPPLQKLCGYIWHALPPRYISSTIVVLWLVYQNYIDILHSRHLQSQLDKEEDNFFIPNLSLMQTFTIYIYIDSISGVL